MLAWVGALTLGKALLVLAVMRLLGYSLRVSTMTALGLAQVGEFSFILAKAGLPRRLALGIGLSTVPGGFDSFNDRDAVSHQGSATHRIRSAIRVRAEAHCLNQQ